MQKINDTTIVITNSTELSDILENDNSYEYIYMGNNITLEKGININVNKSKIIIDGTYQNIRYTLTGLNSTETSDTICPSSSTKEIELKNMDIIYTNTNSPIYTPQDKNYKISVTYNNIKFNGTQLSFNPYGTTKILDSNITIEQKNDTLPEKVCESDQVIIGGNTNITSNSTTSSMFIFRNNTNSPNLIFLCKSTITLQTDVEELMNGTNKLNFTILHDTVVTLITGNGFSAYSTTGANNVLIDERATFTFIEKSHQRIPMWNIFGNLTIKKGAKVEIINTYDDTPKDNYNIHFKGTNQKITIDNPRSIAFYTKNANVIYTNNELTFNIKCNRINMWNESIDKTIAGGINNLPDYYWYKKDAVLELTGKLTASETTLENHNLTTEELANLPDINNFKFNSKKQLSIGTSVINIHPINSNINTISGHTLSFSDVLIKYNAKEEIVTADYDGLFTLTLTDPIIDNTEIEITSCVPNSFVYKTRKITTPYTGELSILDTTSTFNFNLTPISTSPYIFIKDKEITIKVVDSRENKSNWKLYSSIEEEVKSLNNFILENALIFKKIDGEIINLTKTPTLVYTNENTDIDNHLTVLTYSKEKGPLLILSNCGLEVNEEYFATIIFSLEE